MVPEEIVLDENFTDMGMDSIVGVQWVQSINQHYGLSAAVTVVYDYPTLRQFADFLAQSLDTEKTDSVEKGEGDLNSQPQDRTDETSGADTKTIVLTDLKSFDIGEVEQTDLDRMTDRDNPPIVLASLDGFIKPKAPAATTAPRTRAEIPIATLLGDLKDSLAQALYMEAEEVGLEESFVEMGLDSIVGVQWIQTVNQRYGTALAVTAVYDYPSLRDFASYLSGLLVEGGDTSETIDSHAVNEDIDLERLIDDTLQQLSQGDIDAQQASQLLEGIENNG